MYTSATLGVREGGGAWAAMNRQTDGTGEEESKEVEFVTTFGLSDKKVPLTRYGGGGLYGSPALGLSSSSDLQLNAPLLL